VDRRYNQNDAARLVDETVSCKDMVVREHGGEFAIDPIGRGSGRQRQMLRDPRTGQSVILPVDGPETGGYGVSGPPGRRFAANDRAKPARSSNRSVIRPLGLYAS
jgi:hypothetical protein